MKKSPSLKLIPKVPVVDSSLLKAPFIRSPILRKKSIKPEQLPDYVQALMAMMAPYHLAAAHQELLRGAMLGERWAVDKIMQMYGITGGKTPLIQQTITLAQQNVVTGERDGDRIGFDSIVRRLAEERQKRRELEEADIVEVQATPVA